MRTCAYMVATPDALGVSGCWHWSQAMNYATPGQRIFDCILKMFTRALILWFLVINIMVIFWFIKSRMQ